MAKFDLTPVLAKYMDLHLVLPQLEFLGAKRLYPLEDLLQSKLSLLAKTNMADFEMDIFKSIHETDSVPEEMSKRRSIVVSTLRQLETDCAPLLELLTNTELVKDLLAENVFTMQNLEQHYHIAKEMVDSLYRFAKFTFECGNYTKANEYLYFYRLLGDDPEKLFASLWGKLGAEILLQEWDKALEELGRIKDAIESRHYTQSLVQLQHRAWLLHWSLFIFFNHLNGKEGLVEMFFQERYLNTIQTDCPHLLRYLATAAITSKRRRHVVMDLVERIQQEQYAYEDPITSFVKSLYVDFDFEAAQRQLKECEAVLKNDFFLVSCREEFLENARLSIFETYCRIHNTIDISMLAARLDMSKDQAEHWIVNLIRGAHLDAKIDSKENSVILYSQYPDMYQQIIEKTKGLSLRVLHGGDDSGRKFSQKKGGYRGEQSAKQ